MKKIGYALIVAGFLAGAYFTVVQAEGVPVASYIGALVVGIVGVFTVRTAIRQEATHEETLAANMNQLETSLEGIVTRVTELNDRKDEINVYDLRIEIDKHLPPLFDQFVEARMSVGHRYGLQAYADVMNPFAAGERYINRVWSASTDGYIDEAHQYLAMAKEQFEEVGTVLDKISRTPA